MTGRQYNFHVFLSHNSVQKDWARMLAARLRDEGLAVFFDEDSIQLGEDIVASIERALRGSRHVLLVLSPDAISSQWVALELSTSLYRDPGAAARTIIPILRADCDIPLTLARLRYLDARRDDDFEKQIVHLLKAIDRVPIEARARTPTSHERKERLTGVFYPGGTLAPDADIYVSREADRALSSWLGQRNLVCTVWGPRQVGKSSLLVRSVSEFRARNQRAAFVDLSGVGGGSLPQVLFEVCQKIARDLEVPGPAAEPFLSSGFGAQSAFSDFLQGLGAGVLVAFDEVDYLRAIGELASFVRTLRALRNAGAVEGSDTRILVSGVLPPNLYLENDFSSPFNVGYTLELGNFRPDEARLMFEKGNVHISDNDFGTVFSVTGGQPYLTHVAASLIRQGHSVTEIVASAGTPDGPFAMHLRTLLTRIEQSSSAVEGLRRFNAGKRLTGTQVRELMETGVMRQDSDELGYSSGAYRVFFEACDWENVV